MTNIYIISNYDHIIISFSICDSAPFALQLYFGIKSTDSLQGSGKNSSLLCDPEHCVHAPRSFEKRWCAHIVTETGWALLLLTSIDTQYIRFCYNCCFFSKGQGPRGSATFHLMINTYWIYSLVSFHMWEKISNRYSLCSLKKTHFLEYSICIAYEWSQPWSS